MRKCSMWNPETNNKTLPTKLPLIEGQQKETNIQGIIRKLLRRDCEVKKMIRFLWEIRMFEEI